MSNQIAIKTSSNSLAQVVAFTDHAEARIAERDMNRCLIEQTMRSVRSILSKKESRLRVGDHVVVARQNEDGNALVVTAWRDDRPNSRLSK